MVKVGQVALVVTLAVGYHLFGAWLVPPHGKCSDLAAMVAVVYKQDKTYPLLFLPLFFFMLIVVTIAM